MPRTGNAGPGSQCTRTSRQGRPRWTPDSAARCARGFDLPDAGGKLLAGEVQLRDAERVAAQVHLAPRPPRAGPGVRRVGGEGGGRAQGAPPAAPLCAPGRNGRNASMGRPDRGCTRCGSPSRGEQMCGRRVVTTPWSRSFAKAAGRQTLRRPGAAMWCVGRSRRRAPARAIRWSSVRAPAKNMISGFGWLKAPISGYTDCEFIASDTAKTPSPQRRT